MRLPGAIAGLVRVAGVIDYGFVAADIPELTLGVASQARGRGIGTALMRRLLDRAVADGIADTATHSERAVSPPLALLGLGLPRRRRTACATASATTAIDSAGRSTATALLAASANGPHDPRAQSSLV